MKKLNTSDWIQAGFRALTLGGPQAINIEKIAKGLKVSKGSFYWHFKNLDAFKQSMISFWQQRGTADIIQQIAATETTPQSALALLLETATQADYSEIGGPKAESAIRDWARYDQDVASAFAKIDHTRLTFVSKQFELLGQPPAKAEQSARILYGALIGLENLQPEYSNEKKDDMLNLLECLIK